MHSSVSQLFMQNISSTGRFFRGCVAVLLVNLTAVALSPTARAVDPPPDGGYPGNNTAEGDNALMRLTTGTDNTAVGFNALRRDMIGTQNTAIGSQALSINVKGDGNTAIGFQAMLNNHGFSNTATGARALLSNTPGAFGSYNSAYGAEALFSNRAGSFNTAAGQRALIGNLDGNYNTVSGYLAAANTNGSKNTANGALAMLSNKDGNANTADGYNALRNTTGNFNIGLGVNAGSNVTTGSHNIDIGNEGRAEDSGQIRMGTPGLHTATFITGIRGVTTANANAVPVVIDSAGQLGTVSSSARFKDQIEPMNSASEAIMELKPVRFHYKTDKQNTPQFGLIAEEVAKVNPDLVVRDEDGEIYTVRYDAVNAMLLNEFLKEHKKVEEQGAMIAQQQKQIEALTATVQKVSDQIALSTPVPQLVANP
jgi:Chaperone of endosialidase